MKSSKTNGFTIIEVLLFIAITGLLVASVLATTGGTINSQRYKDSSSSLKSMIQMQYSNAINVDNQRLTDGSCGGTDSVAGQSDCVIWGRIIRFNATDTKSKISSRYVISESDVDLGTYDSDFAIFEEYGVKEPAADLMVADIYDMEWGTSISKVLKPGGTDESTVFTMLIMRSPLTGVLTTYMLPEAPSGTLIEFIEKAKLGAADNKYLDLCVDSEGLISDTIRQTAVRIYASATSASGVEIIGDKDSKCP